MAEAKGSVRYRNGSWHYRIDYGKLGGKRQQREKGGFATESAARKALLLAQADFSGTGLIPGNQKLTFEEVYKKFITEECPSTREYFTIVKYNSIFLNHCLECFGPYNIAEISLEQIDMKIKVWSEIYSYDYANGMYHFLFALFAFAQKRKYIKYNPMMDATGPKCPRGHKEVRFFSTDELDRLKVAFAGSSQEVAFMLGLHLGVRISECYALRWSDINWENQTVKINKQLQQQNGQWVFSEPKTVSSHRTITFGKTLKEFLLRYWNVKHQQYNDTPSYKQVEYNQILDIRKKNEPTILKVKDFIIVKDNGEMYKPSSARALRLLAENSGIKFKFHFLRHTHATYLATRFNPKYVMERLGHSKVETTMRYYVHIPSEMQAQAANAIDEMFGNETNRPVPDENVVLLIDKVPGDKNYAG